MHLKKKKKIEIFIYLFSQTEGFGYRVSGAGDNIGLNVLIVPEADKYTSVVRTFQGVHVAVHHVKEIADLSNLVAGQPGYDVKIIVTPSTLTADPEVFQFISILNFK